MRLTRDGKLLFLTRFIRLFSYGMLAVVLVLYLTSIGLSESQTGLLMTLTLAGDTAISLVLTTQADRIGRRRMLIVGSMLMAGAGLAFALTNNFAMLLLAGTIGVISPSGNEVGPFLPIEQGALSEVVSAQSRTGAFAWYALTGALATATGSLAGGLLTAGLEHSSMTTVASRRTVVSLYAVMGLVLAIVFSRLSTGTERQSAPKSEGMARILGIGSSRAVVLRLSGLFAWTRLEAAS